MVADLAETYGVVVSIDLDEPPGVMTLAALWAQLPTSSRCVRKHVPEAAWGDSERMLWSVEHSLRVRAWQRTKDAQKRRGFPTPLEYPWERERRREAAERALANRKEIADALGLEVR